MYGVVKQRRICKVGTTPNVWLLLFMDSSDAIQRELETLKSAVELCPVRADSRLRPPLSFLGWTGQPCTHTVSNSNSLLHVNPSACKPGTAPKLLKTVFDNSTWSHEAFIEISPRLITQVWNADRSICRKLLILPEMS
jgi:hypothetical protein